MTTLGVALVAVVMAVGLIGTVVPVLPGLLLIWAAALVYGLADGFGAAGGVAFTLISLLLVAGMSAGYVLPKRAGERSGASKSSMRLGLVGAIIGFFVIPVIGLPIGGALGVLLGEYQRLQSWPAAWTATRSVLGGFGMAVLAEFTAGVAMVGIWVVWVIVGR